LACIKNGFLARYDEKLMGHHFWDTLLSYHHFMWTQILARYHRSGFNIK